MIRVVRRISVDRLMTSHADILKTAASPEERPVDVLQGWQSGLLQTPEKRPEASNPPASSNLALSAQPRLTVWAGLGFSLVTINAPNPYQTRAVNK